MPTQLLVTAISWERIHITIDLHATWRPPHSSDAQPVAPREKKQRVAKLRALTAAATAAAPHPPAGLTGSGADDPYDGDEHAVAIATAEMHDAASSEPVETGLTPPKLGGLLLRDVNKSLDLDWECVEDGHYRVHINISNFAKRNFLPAGTWKIHAWLDDGSQLGTLVGARWPLATLEKLDEFTRVFLYAGNKSAYTVSFGITESDTNPLLAIRAYNFNRGGSGRPSPFTHPIKRAKSFAKSLTSEAKKKQVARQIYSRAAQAEDLRRAVTGGHTSARKPRILFASEARTGIEGNLLAVRDRMVARGLDAEYEFRYSFRTKATSNSLSLIKLLQEMGHADIILLDDYFPPLAWLNVNPKTKVIQLWHAGSGFKSIGYSRFGKFGSPALTNAHRFYTYTITGSKKLKHVYSEAFGIEEEAIIPTGLPRIDAFLDPAEQEASRAKAYQEFPALKGKRVIMFAPTFRGRGAGHASYPYQRIDFQALYDLCGEDTVVAFRMHHFIPGQVPIPAEMRDRFIDVSGYRNGNDLLLVTDLLITDYSSIIYEFSLLKRPMLFFAYDEEVYSSVRGFHRPYAETAPGKVAHSFKELLAAIRDEDFETWRGDRFREENFDHTDTSSSDRVIDWLILGNPPTESARRTHSSVKATAPAQPEKEH